MLSTSYEVVSAIVEVNSVAVTVEVRSCVMVDRKVVAPVSVSTETIKEEGGVGC